MIEKAPDIIDVIFMKSNSEKEGHAASEKALGV